MPPDMSAKAKRQAAARARRLAGTLVLDADRQQLLEYADELDREAEALERQAHHQEPAAAAVADLQGDTNFEKPTKWADDGASAESSRLLTYHTKPNWTRMASAVAHVRAFAIVRPLASPRWAEP